MDAAVVPVHLGIIMDGNRRWARSQGLPTLEGHRRGLDVVKAIALAAFERGVKYLTVYGFSVENWQRTQSEVGYLMDLFYELLSREYRELEERGVAFKFLGRREGLPVRLLEIIDKIEARTSHLTQGTLGLCLNYSGRIELADAYRALAEKEGEIQNVTPEMVSRYLYAPEIPPVDLIIRTSGEQRLSNFMLWRAAYSELYFSPVHWPAFTVHDLDTALAEFASRQRRYGV